MRTKGTKMTAISKRRLRQRRGRILPLVPSIMPVNEREVSPGMSGTPATSGLSSDAQRLLAWLRDNYWGGQSPVYSTVELARGVYPRAGGPAPGSTFDASAWGLLRAAIFELESAGLVEQGRLPQGDFGYRLRT